MYETPGQLKFWSWLHGFQFVFTDQSIQRIPISSSQKANEKSQISTGLWENRTFHSRGHGPHECWKIFHGYENREFCGEKCCTARRLENIYQCSICFYCDGLTLLVQFQKASSQCQSNRLLVPLSLVGISICCFKNSMTFPSRSKHKEKRAIFAWNFWFFDKNSYRIQKSGRFCSLIQNP